MEGGKLTATLKFAIERHGDQRDKGGVIYIEHLLEVSYACFRKARVVGLLHDVIEDTDTTIEEVCAAVPLSREERNALVLVTRINDESNPLYKSYADYVQSIADSGNEIAIEVKRADLLHNMSPERELIGKQGESLFKRHLKALKIISPEDAEEIEYRQHKKIWES